MIKKPTELELSTLVEYARAGTYTQTARNLELPWRTVKDRLRRVREKTGSNSAVQALYRCLQNGWIHGTSFNRE